MKSANLCRYLALWLVVSSLLPVSAVTFTSDTTIGIEDTNYDGADIVITNCTLTVDGAHSFASLQILQGGRLTHTAVAKGYFLVNSSVTNEEHRLVGTNAEALVHSSVVLASVLVQDDANSVTYSNEVDYLLVLDENGRTLLQRTESSAIPDGATVRVAYSTSYSVSSGLQLDVAGDVAVETGGAINVDGRGYDLKLGPGAGGSVGSILSGGGGGHGGYGGLSASNAPGGNAYGSIILPSDKGSGGGDGYRGSGGPGGGAVKLVVGGALRVDGAVSANGADGLSERSGGGAGGSIWLSAQTLSGTGSITAQGGSGEPTLGGGGGGGRIALYFDTNSFSGLIQARGGRGAVYGGAGTIYSKPADALVGSVLVDNGGVSGANTLLVAQEPFDLTVQGGAILSANSPVTLGLGNLLVNSNGWVSLSNSASIVTGDATIQPGGGIIADGTGFPGGSGPGFGKFSTTNGISTGGGAGYGGPGASSALGAAGGPSYDTGLQSMDRGSGGGNVPYSSSPNGGSGGGAIRLTVNGTLQVEGRISANGLGGLVSGSGGGSGGGLWLTVSNLAGTGVLSACGGAGNGLGGSGGGGRIALYYYTNIFNGSLQAWGGGNGSNCGGPGTIYLRDRTVSSGTLLMDNGGRPGVVTPLPGAQSGSTLILQGAASVSFSASGSQTFRDLFIASNSWLWSSNSFLTILNDAIIQAGGGISVDAAGFSGFSGPGAGRTYPYYPASGGITYQVGGGGGHGGYGGAGIAGGAGTLVYDPPAGPFSGGSGGGNGSDSYPLYQGGAGGGALRLSVVNALVLDGVLSANGAAPAGRNAGGGAGGGIWLSAKSITGSGAICANGGAGNGLGGGGGGGRIAISYQTNSFSGAISAFGAPGFNRGGAGTVYLQGGSPWSVAQYIIDNGGQTGALTDLGSLNSSVDLAIQGGALAIWPFSSSPKLANLLIASNSWLLLSNQNSIFHLSGNAAIQAGGGINGNGCGSPAGGGQGAGRFYGSSPAAGGGAGYGGYGGSGGNSMAYGGTSYGPVLQPTLPGSGGASAGINVGGAGGASLQLSVDGTLVLDGRISVDGNPGLGQNSGGGSGGALWLTVGSILGSGSLSANGGAGALPLGGGGGGGRIDLTVLSQTNGFAGAITAFGAPGFNRGGAGTVYLHGKSSQPVPQYIIDNGGQAGALTDLGSLSSSVDLTLRGGALAISPLSSSPKLANLLIASNSWLLLSNQNTSLYISSNATIHAGGGINGNGGGAPAGSGPGAGRSYPSGGGGAGYGGYGGGSGGYSMAYGGNCYGPALMPTQPGSGGGSAGTNAGGAGGVSLQLSVDGTLVLDGRISADGNPGLGQNSGGGSGGALWLTVGSILGTGSLSANGGAGALPLGGGGGGGRISLTVLAQTNGFAGAITAFGGGAYFRGGAGTIFTREGSQNVGLVLVDNNGLRGTNTTMTDSTTCNLTIRGGGSFFWPNYSSFSCRNILLASNGWLTVATQPLSVTGDVTIQAGGGIVAEGTGYGPGSGPGGGYGTYSGPKGGGGYGGYGGSSGSPPYSGRTYGSSASPTETGSGGASASGSSFAPFGGAGGGAIVLNTRGNVRVDGCISANGNPGDTDSGGGSGGSVWLTVGTLSGSGTISANGGAGKGLGGGGGGGRIALNYSTNRFTGIISAYGGAGAPRGGAGTIYSRTSQGPGQIVLDNGGMPGMDSSLGSGLPSTTDLVLQNGATLGAQASPALHNLLIRSNSWMTFSNFSSLTLSGDLTIQPGGGIIADGTGYAAGQGAGAGGTISSGYSVSGGGGGHGGYGAASAFGAFGGNAYDLVLAPNLAGSGGGNGAGSSPYNRGGTGGGVITVNIQGTLQNDGRISADGTAGLGPSSGGGAGGSISLSAKTLTGSGIISANGGGGDDSGGGGGGGRIAISYLSNLFSGPVTAFGGAGAAWGGAGTVYWAPLNKSWNHGRVVADNGGHFGTNTPISVNSLIDLLIQGGARAVPANGSLLLSNLVVRADGTLTSFSSRSNLEVAVVGDALIEPGALIGMDGLGFAQNSGPGAGLSSDFIGSGAGYGGAGGASPFLPGGTNYGSASHPVDRGSGGGLGWGPLSGGGEGGGALRLSVGGTLTLDGRISANGNPGCQDDAGGGSGGSLWISAGTLAGTGSLAAEGGAGEFYQGSGGGGGRIALYTPTNSFAGSISAAGGPGWSAGSTGSVFFATSFDLPVIVAQTPVGLVSNAVSYIDLAFNNPVSPDAVWYPGFALDTPVGTVPGALVEAASLGASTLRFYLPLQTAVGDYTLRLSSALVWDIFGQPLSEGYTNTFTIALPLIQGTITDTNGVPVPGVVLQPSEGSPAITDANGRYVLGAPLGLSFSVTPTKPGLVFVPGTRSYSNVTNDLSGEDYLAVTTITPVVQADRSATNLVMNWQGIPGVRYQAMASTNLIDWYYCSGLLPGTNGCMRLEVPIGTEPYCFYRLQASN